MQIKHTPPPWFAGPMGTDEYYGDFVEICTEGGELIALVPHVHNVDVLLHAPGMLRELERLMDVICDEDREIIAPIIAKARGER